MINLMTMCMHTPILQTTLEPTFVHYPHFIITALMRSNSDTTVLNPDMVVHREFIVVAPMLGGMCDLLI